MTDQVQIPLDGMIPSVEDILHDQGMPRNAVISDKIKFLVDKSLGLFSSDARPLCITREVSRNDFDEIFRGEGHNEKEAPLKTIYPQADRLVLFVLTMGQRVSRRITGFFGKNDFALGSMLDTVASLAVENSIGYLENLLAGELAGKGRAADGSVVLNYSPGYCGWHISAQKKVFLYLHPERIGISLNDSSLMTPLKSATGVLVHGTKAIHSFDNGFSFCRTCKEQTCLERRDRLSYVG
ncbi:MAG TPA: hypothetical protein VJO14_08630 [Bacteroidota bacterium]|nr:hypothetical protein [Bacteroidota bacterium]